MRKLATAGVVSAALGLIYLAGGLASARLLDGIVVGRDGDGSCLAVDTESGRPLGSFAPQGERCRLADWRMTHPFGGWR